jgi:hypothetical protein
LTYGTIPWKVEPTKKPGRDAMRSTAASFIDSDAPRVVVQIALQGILEVRRGR